MNRGIVARTIGFVLLLALAVATVPASGQVGDRIRHKELEYAATKTLQAARKLMKQGKYEEALFDLIRIVDYYPEYSRADEAFVDLGNCLLSLGLYSAAEPVFKHVILNYTGGRMVPFALFGLEHLNYLKGNYTVAIDYFRFIRQRFPDAPLGEGIFYYGGQSFLYSNEYDNAILAFSAIDENSEYWGYALYSRAQAYLKKKILMRRLQTFGPFSSSQRSTRNGTSFRNGPGSSWA